MSFRSTHFIVNYFSKFPGPIKGSELNDHMDKIYGKLNSFCFGREHTYILINFEFSVTAGKYSKEIDSIIKHYTMEKNYLKVDDDWCFSLNSKYVEYFRGELANEVNKTLSDEEKNALEQAIDSVLKEVKNES